jgi:hypothetical protein
MLLAPCHANGRVPLSFLFETNNLPGATLRGWMIRDFETKCHGAPGGRYDTHQELTLDVLFEKHESVCCNVVASTAHTSHVRNGY